MQPDEAWTERPRTLPGSVSSSAYGGGGSPTYGGEPVLHTATTPSSAENPFEPTSPLVGDAGETTIQLHEEQLVAHKEAREVGSVDVRIRVEQVPARLEVDAYQEEVEVEHVPVGKVVSDRAQPWEEDGALIIPIYEEQLVVVKRLVLREQLKVRRVRTTQRHLFEDTLQREVLDVDRTAPADVVHERYNSDLADHHPAHSAAQDREGSTEHPHEQGQEQEEGGFLHNLGRKVFL